MPLLGVNIDHVATLRQARRGVEPDPLRAAHEAELGGADIITVHLREDRRHIQDHDVEQLRSFVQVRLNLEMAPTQAMTRFARELAPRPPDMVTLVPEGREEITTEGGLDVAQSLSQLRDVKEALADAGVVVSAFIDAEEEQVAAAAEAGFDACELHTGPYAHAFADCGGDFLHERLARELARLERAGELIAQAGMRFNAGHGLNLHNVGPVAALPELSELHIGHALVSRAVFMGLRQAVADMKLRIAEAQRR